jgi:hypothetical protein
LKRLFSILLIIVSLNTFSQTDSTDYFGEDSIIPVEEFPNYVGFNISPLVGSIISQNDRNVKLTASYKRNFGDKNLRTSFNYITKSHYLPFDNYKIVNTTDSSYDVRFFTTNHRTFDIRLGFEELRGYRFSRLHVGADLIVGYGEYDFGYFSRNYQVDSSGTYRYNSDLDVFDAGLNEGKYLDLGLDISFGFDWFMSDQFLFTFQLTPQLNYYILTNSKINDPLDQLEKPKNIPEFNIGFFDVYLYYKF